MHKITPLLLILTAASLILPALPAIHPDTMAPSGVAIRKGGFERVGSSGAAYAQPQNWRSEVDEICSKTQDAAALTSEELKQLIERCDKLKEQIETLDETQRKVFLKRLQMCRDLYMFMLEVKEKNKP